MSYTKTNWENLPSTNTPLNASNLNKIESELVNKYEKAMSSENSAVTNSTTSGMSFGPTLNITTTGKPLIVICSAVGRVNGGNIDYYVTIGNQSQGFGGHSNSARERTTGFAIFDNLPAGNYDIKMAFACSQANRTATIEPYVSNSILAFEI